MATDQDAVERARRLTDIAEVGGPEGVERLVRSLVDIMRDGGLSKLDLNVGTLSVKLRGKATGAATIESTARSVGPGPPAAPELAADHVITAPMIGTFYAAASPGDPPLIDVGDQVSLGQVVGIIEAMKIMNEIVADQAGEVAAILVKNGQAVEYGFPLILLAPAGSGA
ncbi:MAG: acetyl-CoA carboxylase, biotin carboxyl carrier protein [Chloroflexota bacterium]|nr:acetyl-CoA carboxylase, biotin carboxyl carrier protein [Chloroflexota bacterium]